MEYTIDYSLKKLRKIAKKTLDSLRGMHGYYFPLRKIFFAIEDVVVDTEHKNYSETETLLISLLESKWHPYLKRLSYCYLIYATKKGNYSDKIRQALDVFCSDNSNLDIIRNAYHMRK